MIVTLLINLVILILGAVFSSFDQVTTLPNILGYNIDESLLNGMGNVNRIAETFWPLQYLFLAFLAIVFYVGVKITIKFFLGNRSPVHN